MSLCFLVGPIVEFDFVEENKPVTFSISKYATFYSDFYLIKVPLICDRTGL